MNPRQRFLRLGIGSIDIGCSELEVLPNRQPREKLPSLGHHGNPQADDFIRTEEMNLLRIEGDGTLSGFDEAGDRSKEGRFARSVRTDDGDPFSLLDLETHLPEGLDVPIIDVNLVQA